MRQVLCLLTFLLVAPVACGPVHDPEDSDLSGKVALDFADALVAGDFAGARNLLASELAEQLSEAQLQSAYEGMIEYGEGPATGTPTQLMNTLGSWPDKQPDDGGWAYVAIVGPGYSEAITVVVTRSGRIRQLEWGRP
jgi:hypothetical protein